MNTLLREKKIELAKQKAKIQVAFIMEMIHFFAYIS